jgi:hypothetical protein
MAEVNINIPEDIEKIERADKIDFLDTTPTAEEPTWAIVGIGIKDKSTDYNADITDDPWIIYKNNIKEVNKYAPTSGVTQTAHKGDPEFEYVDNLRYRLATGKDAETRYLEVDKYFVTDEDTTPKFRARQWTVAISIDSDGGENAEIGYTINYKGDPKFGTVSFANGKPVFTEETTKSEDE